MDFIVYGILKRLIGNKEAELTQEMNNYYNSAVNLIQQEENRAETEEQNLLDLINKLDARLQFIANSTDEELDQIAELVNFIKENRESILLIFKDKVNISDIIDNLTSPIVNQPLSANQGVVLREMIEALQKATNERLIELNEDFTERIDNLEEDTLEKITNLTNKHNTEIAELTNKHNTDISALTEQHNNDITELTNKHNTEIKALTDDLTKLDKKHDNDIGVLNANLTTNINNLTDKHNTDITNLTSEMNTKISLLENNSNTNVTNINATINSLEQTVTTKNNQQDSALNTHLSDYNNPHNVTKAQLGLGVVENKTSATIRSELTKSNVTTALGYTPMTPAEVTTAITNLENKINKTPPFIVSTTAPSNTYVFWIDPNVGLKYHNGSSWVIVPTAWS